MMQYGGSKTSNGGYIMATRHRRVTTSREAIDTVPLPEIPMPDYFPGIEGDPPTPYLLNKAKVAQLKISKLDMIITTLEKEIDLLKLEQNLLKQEYKLK